MLLSTTNMKKHIQRFWSKSLLGDKASDFLCLLFFFILIASGYFLINIINTSSHHSRTLYFFSATGELLPTREYCSQNEEFCFSASYESIKGKRILIIDKNTGRLVNSY